MGVKATRKILPRVIHCDDFIFMTRDLQVCGRAPRSSTVVPSSLESAEDAESLSLKNSKQALTEVYAEIQMYLMDCTRCICYHDP